MDRAQRRALAAQLNNDLQAAEQRLRESVAEQEAASARVIRDRDEVSALQALLAYVEGGSLEPQASSKSSPGPPQKLPARFHVKRILRRSTEPLDLQSLLAEMLVRGWTTESREPEAVLRTTLHRMVAQGDVVQSKAGTFHLPQPKLDMPDGDDK